jgi:hypothetical protein
MTLVVMTMLLRADASEGGLHVERDIGRRESRRGDGERDDGIGMYLW